jgi:hypothetical protein
MTKPMRGLVFISCLAVAGPAAAQLGYDPMIVAADPAPWIPSRHAPPPHFRMPRGDLREAPGPRPNGLIAAMPLGGRLTVGVGRFQVVEQPRPRTYNEHEPRPADVRRRERGIAAVGFSVRF